MKYLQHVEVRPHEWRRIWEETSKQALYRAVQRVYRRLQDALRKEKRR